MRVENDLKPHNVETIKQILEFYKTSNKCCAIQATGTGKTFLILRLLEIYNDMDKSAVIFVPNREIINQTKKRMKKFGLNNATFYTYQKLARMTDEEIENINADLIVCDELHRTGAKTWGQKFEVLVETHSDSKVFGVTATPLRCTDGRDMSEEYFDGNKACDISLAEALVREIIPVMPVYVSALYTFEEEYNNRVEKIKDSRNTNEEKLELMETLKVAKQQLEKSNGVPEIIRKYITNFNGKYIVFCKDKKHLYAMKDVVVNWFRQAGFDGKVFEYPFYSMSSAVKKNFDEFQNNKEDGLKLLFVIDKLNEGLHLEDIQGCILLRTTTSNIIYYQQIGRAIDAGSNEKRVILDLVSNFNSLKSFNLKDELKKSVQKRRNGEFPDCSEDFEIEKFDVEDMIQDCVDVFSSIDKKIKSKKGDIWTIEEIDILKKYYPTIGTSVKQYLPNRTEEQIKTKASTLHIRLIYWSDEEISILKKYYPIMGKKCSKFLPNKTEYQIYSTASRTGITKRSVSSRAWTEEELKILYENYKSNNLYSLLPNRKPNQITAKMSKLGLKRERKTSSKYKYVTYKSHINKYVVQFSVDGSMKCIGVFEDEDEAGKIAMEKAKEYGKV